MCKQDQHPNPVQSPPPACEKVISDKEIQRANLEVQLVTLRANAEYNASPAGQMQRQFETYQRIAKPLSESDYVPAEYKNKMGNCIIAVEMAARLGVFPLAVMQNLCIVKGNPTWKSKFLIGCVNASGRFSILDYKITIDGVVGDVNYKTWEKDRTGKNREVYKQFQYPALDNLVCVAYATELKTGKILTSTPVSIRMAVQEGWYTKDGSKWPAMPEQMLRYRAASFWVSAYAPEMSMGLRTEEEQRDIIDIDYEDLTDNPNASNRKPKPTASSVEQAKEKLRNRATTAKEQKDSDKPATDMP